MKYIAILFHYLFNSYKVVFKSNIKELEEIRMVPISIRNPKESDPTHLFYINENTRELITSAQTIVLDYKRTLHLLPIMSFCLRYMPVKNFIILSAPSYNNIYKERYIYQALLPNTNVFLLESPYNDIFRKNYDFNGKQSCLVVVYNKVENILLIVFYLILALSMGLLYVIFRLWLGIYADKDPVCTISELSMCPTMPFQDVKNKCLQSCLICMEQFEKKDVVRMLTCNHYYHTECVDGWLENMSARCPYCRKMMKMDV